jgi:hypothetical protein
MGQKKNIAQKASVLSLFKQNHPRQVPSCMELSGFGGAQKELNQREGSEKQRHPLKIPWIATPPHLFDAVSIPGRGNIKDKIPEWMKEALERWEREDL